MNKKLTISIDELVYNGLITVVGRGSIGRFLENLARPFVDRDFLDSAYASMASDKIREDEAVEWCNVICNPANSFSNKQVAHYLSQPH